MLKRIKLSMILSPSLGCPQIIPLDKDKIVINIIIASENNHFGEWKLIPSYNKDNQFNDISLEFIEVQEIPIGTGLLPTSIDETREYISQELYLEVFCGNARFYKVKLEIADYSKLPRKVNDSSKPTLYDLHLEGAKKKDHAVCFTESQNDELNFIHLTDLHIARRNDIIQDDISAVIGPIDSFNNFNDKLRQFIKKANQMADRSELDFVFIGGDLVDFVNHGVSDEVIGSDNNWHVFIEILTGSGNEHERGNYGIQVPIFTSTGNHDYRLHPYDVENNASTYGISKDQANNFDFEYYDSIEQLNEKKDQVYKKIVSEGSPTVKKNILRILLKKIFRYFETINAKTIIPIISGIGGVFSMYLFDYEESKLWSLLFVAIAYAIISLVNFIRYKIIRLSIVKAIISIEAGVHALHYYFLHINPFFNYTFSFDSNHFIVMDTGSDCLIGQYLWDEGNKKMKSFSIKDNIIGMSPDSMAFYPANESYSYSQISWLENALKAIEQEKASMNKTKKIFICLHSPPININKTPALPNNSKELLLKKNKHNITYGSINHFLSQFFHLCVGKKECDEKYTGPKVDIVFSGHAHKEIEFRIDFDNSLNIYYGKYSNSISQEDFNSKKPFVVQTPACGPLKDGYPNPPYFRTVHINENGIIDNFKTNSV